MGSIPRAYANYSWSYYSNSRNRNVRLPFSKWNPPDICTWRQGAWQTRQARLSLRRSIAQLQAKVWHLDCIDTWQRSQCYMDHLCSLEANNKKMALLRESQIMKIHYITGVAAIFVVAVHIMMRIAIMPYGMSLEYENVIANYQNIPYIVLLESILVLVAIHGFNGLRVILLELRQSKKWEDGVTVLTIGSNDCLNILRYAYYHHS